MPTTKFALAILSVLLLVLPAAAQQSDTVPLRAEGEHLLFDALDHQLALPLPDWLRANAASDNLLDLVSPRFQEEGSQAHIEIYPRGESEALWSKLYGARIFSPSSTALTNLRSVIIDVYGRACRPETVALFQMEADDGDNIPPLGFVCGAYHDLPGYRGMGEVMVMGFYRSANGIGIVYQEWRGTAFNAEDSSTWPVSTAEIEQVVARFKTDVALKPLD